VLMENSVVGEPLIDLGLKDQLTVVGRVFTSYIALAGERARGSAAEILAPIVEAAAWERLPQPLRSQLSNPKLIELARTWPLVPSMGDCQAGNLIVAAGQRPVFVDCFPLAWMPYFYGPLYLACITNRSSLGFSLPTSPAIRSDAARTGECRRCRSRA
jgi:hypothetical protein